MIICLVNIGSSPSAAHRVLARTLESGISGSLVQRLELVHPRPDPANLDLLLSQLLETSPQVVGLGCGWHNVSPLNDLCGRLQLLLPRTRLVIGGPAAAAVTAEAELISEPDVDRELLRLLGGTIAEPGAELYAGQLDQLRRSSREAAVVLEPTWGGELSIAQHCQLRAVGGLTVQQAHTRLEPLLAAGIPVRLLDPLLTSHPRRLGRLLALLQGAARTLQLELPDTLLEPRLVHALCGAGLRRVRLELGGLARGELEPRRLGQQLARLAAEGVVVIGELTYGLPGKTWGDLGQAVDRCLTAGVDRLELRRAQLPPGSRQLGPEVLCAPEPPHQVLCHGACTAEQMLAMQRFAALFSQVSRALAGTGLLRALAREAGSIFETMEDFGDSLAITGHDPLKGPLPESADQLFLDHLRRLGFQLSPSTEPLVRRSPGLCLRWTTDGCRVLSDEVSGTKAHVGWGAVGLVDRYDEARPVSEVCDRIVAEAPVPRRRKLRHDLQHTIDKLLTLGFLVPTTSELSPHAHLEQTTVSLEEFDYHFRMLADSTRVQAYEQAIRRTVRPGDHVVEIGTGSGILAVLAARAGARVTAIERYSIINIARDVAARSGVADRIDFIRGRAEQVELSCKGDLLISEIVGNRILNEGLLEATLDGRRRLLAAGARLIPGAIGIEAELGYTDRFEQVAGELSEISQRHDVDLGPLGDWLEGSLGGGKVVWELGPRDEDGFQTLSDAASVVRLDLTSMQSPEFCSRVTLTPRRQGRANALLLTFQLQLLEDIQVSARDRRLHWCRPVHMLRAPLQCQPGQPVRLQLSYEAHGEITVTACDESSTSSRGE